MARSALSDRPDDPRDPGQAHATFALAAATAIDPDRQREERRDVAGARYTDT
jgi:hypothetical protein